MSAPPARISPSSRSRAWSGSSCSASSGGIITTSPPASWTARTYERASRKASWSQTPHWARSTAVQMPMMGRAISVLRLPHGRNGERGRSGGGVAGERGEDRVARDAGRAEDPRGHAVALAQQPEQQVLGADEGVAAGDRLAQRQRERLLRPPRERQPAAACPPAPAPGAPRQRARPERALDPLADGVEVDAQRGERVRVEVRLADADDPLDLRADRRTRDAVAGQDARGAPLGVVEQPEQQVLGADPAVAQRGGMAVGRDGHGAGLLGQPLEHQPALRRSSPPPCLRWTACLETPRAAPMSCHDQPWSRAWATCRASRRSTSVRSEATARSPRAGSVVSTDSASFMASCALMAVNIR